MACFKIATILLSSSSIGHAFLVSKNPASITASRHTYSGHGFPFAATDVNGSTEDADSTEAATDASPPSMDEPTRHSSQDVIVPPPLADITATQNSLLKLAASTNRGQRATRQQKDTASQLLSTLESTYESTHTPSNDNDDVIPSQFTGTWKLLYSNTQLFRSSPFFLAGRSTCQTSRDTEKFTWFIGIHPAALAISNTGEVRQIISREGRMVNEFEVKPSASPFLLDFIRPEKYSGALIVSGADVIPNDGRQWEIYMDTFELHTTNAPILSPVFDEDKTKLKSQEWSKFLGNNDETPVRVVRTTFINDGMRIVRDEDDNVFVYGRESFECCFAV